jgi:hypothetical protein
MTQKEATSVSGYKTLLSGGERKPASAVMLLFIDCFSSFITGKPK